MLCTFFELPQTFTSVSIHDSIGTRRSCFLFLLENTAAKKKKQLVYFDLQNVNSLCSPITTSTARASSVFLWSYRSTVLNQSACVFALGYFLIDQC